MKITIHSTPKIIELEHDGHVMPARIWEGETESGIPVICYVTRIAANKDHDQTQFLNELEEHELPSQEVQSWPARLII